MLAGLKHLHEKGFAHRQLALENVMIENGTNIVKLVGFGYSCPVNNVKSDSTGANMMTECLGTPEYMAP